MDKLTNATKLKHWSTVINEIIDELTKVQNDGITTSGGDINGTLSADSFVADSFVGPLTGNADTATALTSSAGNANQPVFFDDGKPVAITHTIGVSVPADAKFTDTTYSVATTAADGLFSKEDKAKLDAIDAGANAVTIDTALSSTSTNPVQNKVINSALALKAPLASPAFTGTPTAPTADLSVSNTQIATTAFVHSAITDSTITTPASVKSQNVVIFGDATGDVLADSGYTINASVPAGAKFTDTTYTGSDGIALTGTNFTNSGVRSVTIGGADGTITVNTNGSSAEVAVAGLKSAAFTESTAYAPASHTSVKATDSVLGHVTISDAVNSTSAASAGVAASPKAVKDAYDKAVSAESAAGEAQSTADGAVTAIGEEKTAREGAISALTTTVNGKLASSHASETATGSKASHVTLSDSVTSTSGASAGVAATPAAVKTAYDLASSAKSVADEAKTTASKAYKYAGSVATADNLPTSANEGDVYNVEATGINYAWNGSAWDNLGQLIVVDSTIVSGSTNPVSSGAVYTAIDGINDAIAGLEGADANLQSAINSKLASSHASETATDSKSSHVKLSDATNSTSGKSAGIAATPAAVKSAYDLANTANTTAGTAKTTAEGAVTAIGEETEAREAAVEAINTALEGKAPTSHANSASTYGSGTGSLFGHVKLSDSTSSTSGASAGIAATPAAVKSAYDLANTAKTNAATNATAIAAETTAREGAISTINTALDGKAPTAHAVSGTTYGAATGSVYGHVKLSDSTSSTSAASAGIAASPKAVKSAYDLANTANTAAGTAQSAAESAANASIVNITASGKTVTFTKGDGTTGTFTTQDTNTTYTAGTGLALADGAFALATYGTASSYGPSANATPAFGATFNVPYVTTDAYGRVTAATKTVKIPATTMGAATSSAAGTAGLVPAPAANKHTSFLRGDGTWVVPTNTTYSNMTGATADAAGKAGLVPAPAAGAQAKFLRADGTWQTPTNTDTKVTQTITTTDAEYALLAMADAAATANKTNSARFASAVTLNPSTQRITAKGLKSPALGTTYVSTAQANGAVLDTSITAGAYMGYMRYPSTNGAFTFAGYKNEIGFYYLTQANIDASTNTVTHSLKFNESGLLTSSGGFKGALTGNASTATKATQDSAGQQINTTYIKGLSVSGKTITYTKGDGTTGTITTQDTNTTYSNMTAATADAAGKAGLVPAPAAGKQASFLRGDGTWATPTNTDTKVKQTVSTTNKTYPILACATADATATVTGEAIFASAIKINPSAGSLTATAVYNAVWNDYAEFFPRGEETEAGDIIALDLDSDKEVYVKATKETSKPVGIHSDSFGHLVGGELPENGEDFVEYNMPKFIPVGMTGRVGAKTIGEVKKGDFAVISEIPGVARAFNPATDSAIDVFGMFVENNSEEGIRRVKVKIPA